MDSFIKFLEQFTTREIYKSEVIYISIGSAACLRDKGVDDIPVKDHQQFPPFMKKIHMEYPDLKITLVLIDPFLTDPPYCVQNQINCDKMSNTFYSSNKIDVHYFKEMCTYSDDEYGLDIRPLFGKLITMCKNYPVISFIHNFSGHGSLSVLRDNLLGNNKDLQKKIMFGIDCGQEGGCYIDLLHPTNHPLLEKNNGEYEIFNPLAYPNTNLVSMYHSIDTNIKKMQIKMIIDNIYPSFDNTFMVYRMAKYITSSGGTSGNIASFKYYLNNIDKLYGTSTLKLYEEREYDLLMGCLMDAVKTSMFHVFDTFQSPQESSKTVNSLMNKLLAINDIYKYENIVRCKFHNMYQRSMTNYMIEKTVDLEE